MKITKTIQEHIANWQKSGMSVQEYTHRHKIGRSTFYNWLKKSKIKPTKSFSKSDKSKNDNQAVPFIEIIPENLNQIPYKKSTKSDKSNKLKFEVVFAEGLTLKIYE